MVKKGLGFSWGAAAHATSVWKGSSEYYRREEDIVA